MRKIPLSAQRIAGIVLLSLPVLGMAFTFIVTLEALINPPPNDYAGLNKAAGVFMWAMGGWVAFLGAIVGAHLTFHAPKSTRLSTFFITPPLCLGLGVLLFNEAPGLALFLIAIYLLLSLAAPFVCLGAISSAIKQSKEDPTPTTEPDTLSAK